MVYLNMGAYSARQRYLTGVDLAVFDPRGRYLAAPASLGQFDSRERYLSGARKRKSRAGLNGLGTTAMQLTWTPTLPLDSRFRWGLGCGNERKLTALGDDIVAPDIGQPVFSPDPGSFASSAGPAIPPDFYKGASSRPIVPKGDTTAPTPPNFSVTSEPWWSGVSKVFQSLNKPAMVLPPSPGRPLAPTSFLDQSLIGGVPNKYLLYGGIGLLAVGLLAGGGKGRRR